MFPSWSEGIETSVPFLGKEKVARGDWKLEVGIRSMESAKCVVL